MSVVLHELEDEAIGKLVIAYRDSSLNSINPQHFRCIPTKVGRGRDYLFARPTLRLPFLDILTPDNYHDPIARNNLSESEGSMRMSYKEDSQNISRYSHVETSIDTADSSKTMTGRHEGLSREHVVYGETNPLVRTGMPPNYRLQGSGAGSGAGLSGQCAGGVGTSMVHQKVQSGDNQLSMPDPRWREEFYN